MRFIATFITCLALCGAAHAQTAEDYAVELSATVQESPARITLLWKKIPFGTPVYNVFKKSKTATSWGTSIATLTAADSTYIDNAVVADSGYEYQVSAAMGTMYATGFMYAGVKAPAIHNRGALVLVVDTTFADSCAPQITRLMRDVSGDGWQVIRHDVGRSKPDTYVQALIAADYATHPNLKAVLLLGHIAVPYSGDLNPDAHPDHLGAWPADVYYGTLTGWTDVSVNDIASSYPANRNIPGDGKWDQSLIPGSVQLQVSRIDFFNMPAFASTEVQLMKSYLSREHIYKMDSLGIRHRALITDNFGAFSGEAFAANGWRNFSPLVGRDSIAAVPFVSSMAAASYQWAFGCGGGTFTSAGGVGTTTDFTTNPVNGIFTVLFGSYFGDWNTQNNFLRAPLCASTPALTSCWAGRPNWFFHHMALGEHIGYSTMLTQNNTGALYQPANYAAHGVHIALMGDLTLRTDYIMPPSNLVITKPFHNGAILNWSASPDAGVMGYYVYRADSTYGYFKKLSGMLTATTFHDTLGTSGIKHYMVRPVKLQLTPSGKYYNLGVGITDTGTISYTTVGIASIAIPALEISLYPNPAQNNITVTINTETAVAATISIVNMAGQSYNTALKYLNRGVNAYALNIAHLPSGVYLLSITTGEQTVFKKWVKE
ncbi:MAG: T9SS type A sorting domain-containing protein [Bacteroidota bacterium]